MADSQPFCRLGRQTFPDSNQRGGGLPLESPRGFSTESRADAPLSVERPPRPRPALTTRRGPANRPAQWSFAEADLLKQCLATTVLRSGLTPSGQVSEINRSDQLDSFNVTWQVRLEHVKVLQSITKHTNPLTSGSQLWLALALRFECVKKCVYDIRIFRNQSSLKFAREGRTYRAYMHT